jgi:aryl-alcohol dehydrogenase-like predicted oxidoreductase
MSVIVKQQGFGCMGFSAFYSSAKTTSEEQAIEVLVHAMNHGVNLFSTATIYGELNEIGYGHNLRLLSKFLAQVDRAKVSLAVKIGMDTRCPVEQTGTYWNMRGDYESLNADVLYSLEQLQTDYLDIIVLNRVAANISIEESVAAMKRIVDEGKAKYIGLSEASADTIRRAHAVTPIHYIEQEWSLWSRDIEEEIVPLCRELGIQIIAYSPLGRGFLTGAIKSRDQLDPKDYRAVGQPRFSAENFDKNLALVDAVKAIAEKKGVSAGEIALAWLHAQGSDVIPIPGTTTIGHLEHNLHALSIELSADEIKQINEICDPKNVVGDRYAHAYLTYEANKAK